MAHDVHFAYSRTFPAGVKRAFDELLPFALPGLFTRRFAAIPPIKAVTDQDGEWGAPGQTRTIHLSGGGTMREELLEVTSPRRFAYRISDITGPMKVLATSIDGAWEFEKAGTGVRISWLWRVHPRGRVGAAAMPAFERMWRAYARLNFDNIERIIVR
jgi:hypothetical protein